MKDESKSLFFTIIWIRKERPLKKSLFFTFIWFRKVEPLKKTSHELPFSDVTYSSENGNCGVFSPRQNERVNMFSRDNKFYRSAALKGTGPLGFRLKFRPNCVNLKYGTFNGPPILKTTTFYKIAMGTDQHGVILKKIQFLLKNRI